MIRQTRAAAAQVEALFEHYLARGRDEAARNLLRAVRDALDRIEADPMDGRSHPRSYPGMARWGYRWTKVRRYWFAYVVSQDDPVLSNIIYDAADLPARVEEADEESSILRPTRGGPD